MNSTIVGLIAGVLTTVSLVPQVWKVYQMKSARDFSWGYFAMFWVGLLLWITYGVCKRDWPIIATNVVTLALSLLVGFLKFRYDRRKPTNGV